MWDSHDSRLFIIFGVFLSPLWTKERMNFNGSSAPRRGSAVIFRRKLACLCRTVASSDGIPISVRHMSFGVEVRTPSRTLMAGKYSRLKSIIPL